MAKIRKRELARQQPILNVIRSRCKLEDECWIWQRPVEWYKDGSMRIRMHHCGRHLSVRREAAIAAGIMSLKSRRYAVLDRDKCYNPLCVNPAHLKVVETRHYKKMLCGGKPRPRDEIIRNTLARRKSSILTEAMVAEARAAGLTAAQAALKYGTSKANWYYILSGKTWRPTNVYEQLTAHRD